MRGIIGTGGHIDHGKTALIGALTGEETDRLPEEQARGISIDLGFSRLETRHGTLGVIDVPGHEDFIRNMLAGATGIDVLLLVVAADEGVMPQTREHVAIAELLGVDRAVVALTKTDLVDDDWLHLVRDDVASFLADTAFAEAPVVPVSAREGEGVEAVRSALEDVFEGTRGRPDDLFRMPVDRVFTVRGTGTVVTGTVWSGQAAVDETLRVLPDGPEIRVRGIQVHGGDVPTAEAGQRAALALAGIDREEVERGMAVVGGAGWAPTSMVTASIRMIDTRWNLEEWQRVRVHVGTAEVMARAVLLDSELLTAGQEGLVQLRLEAPLVARSGDRVVLRSYSPVTTIGGGTIIHPLAEKRTRLRSGDLERALAILQREPLGSVRATLDAVGSRGVDVPSLPILTGHTPRDVQDALDSLGAVLISGRAYPAPALEAARSAVESAVSTHHRDRPLEFGMEPEAVRKEAAGASSDALARAALDQLQEEGIVVLRRGRVALPDVEPTLDPSATALRDRTTRLLADYGLEAPRVPELVQELDQDERVASILELLTADGDVVRIEHDLYADAVAVRNATEAVRSALAGRSGLSPGEFRDVLDLSRKHLIPLLEYFDREGITRRSDDGRSVAGTPA